MRRRVLPRGFTLLEIVLIVLIVVALFGLLFPVLSAARKRSRVAGCMGNLRQLGVASALYLADFERYPAPRQLVTSSYLTDRRVLFCPEDTSLAIRGVASSYQFRYRVPPRFITYWEIPDLSPAVVLASCPHHEERRAMMKGDTSALSAARYPYKLVVRAGGGVEQIHLDRIREVPMPGSRPAYTSSYPGEPGYAMAHR
jgi:competence protein ComGC